MIFFIRSYIADFDARMGKYFDALTDAEIPFCFIGWNKDGRPASARRGFRYFSKIAKLGGGWRNAIGGRRTINNCGGTPMSFGS